MKLAAIAVTVGGVLTLLSAPGAAVSGTGNELSAGQAKRVKGRAVAHGPFVPGQAASVSISRMPAGAPLFAFIIPIGGQCDDVQLFCFAQYVAGHPAAAGVRIPPIQMEGKLKKIKTSSRGRAELHFTMPSEFLGSPPSGGVNRYPYVNPQAIKIVATAIIRKHHRAQVIGQAKTKTFVRIP